MNYAQLYCLKKLFLFNNDHLFAHSQSFDYIYLTNIYIASMGIIISPVKPGLFLCFVKE